MNMNMYAVIDSDWLCGSIEIGINAKKKHRNIVRTTKEAYRKRRKNHRSYDDDTHKVCEKKRKEREKTKPEEIGHVYWTVSFFYCFQILFNFDEVNKSKVHCRTFQFSYRWYSIFKLIKISIAGMHIY